MARDVRVPRRVLLAALASTLLMGCGATAPGQDQGGDAAGGSPGSPAAAEASPSPGVPRARIVSLSGTSPVGSGPGAYHYRVDYPQLDGLSSRAQTIDVLIQATIQRDVDDFVDEARASGSVRSELRCQAGAVRLTARLAVLRVDCTESGGSADRPRMATRTFNCDLAGARLLALQDLFTTGSGYLDVIADEARRQLARPGADVQGPLEEGTAPVVANFAAFLLDQGGLVIALPRYAAPGSSSPPQVSMPYATLQRYLAAGILDLVT